MVFQVEAQFQQFLHCKFRENIVRMLYIPTLENGNLFLVANKYGKIGLYHPMNFTLVHTYALDLSVPMHPQMSKTLFQIAKRNQEIPLPKCQRTHMVVDAVFAPDVKSVIFLTTKCILQWYDIGEIEKQSIGLELFPRKEFMNFRRGESPAPLRNKGHVETHRLFGLRESPTCMEYYAEGKIGSSSSSANAEEKTSKLLIGDADGCVTVILIDDPRKPLGCRKIRGVLHEVTAMDLVSRGKLMVYKAHNEMVTGIQFISQRQLIISSSWDKKFSLFVKDFTETVDPYIISLPKGVNCFEHSDSMKIIATGSDDHLVRLFNQFVVNMPQMELMGHRSPVIAVKFLLVPFSDNAILLSLSTDVELRAWNPVDFVCLQSVYISFPIKSTIMCKTPEFAKQCLYVFQPHFEGPEVKIDEKSKEIQTNVNVPLKKGSDGQIVILYCNSFAALNIERETSHWPFDFEDFITEFQEATSTYEKKIRQRQESISKNPKIITLSAEEIHAMESKLDRTVQDMLKIKRDVDRQLGLSRENSPAHPQGLSVQIANKLQGMRRKSGTEALSKAEFVKHGAIFRSFPLYEIPPLKFLTICENGKSMPVTDLMRESGINKVTCLEDILTKKARKCFTQENLRRKEQDAAFYDTNEVKKLEDAMKQEDQEADILSDSEWESLSGRTPSDLTGILYDEYLETSLQKLSEFQAEMSRSLDEKKD